MTRMARTVACMARWLADFADPHMQTWSDCLYPFVDRNNEQKQRLLERQHPVYTGW